MRPENYNVPAASTQAIQSPAGGQESLWRKETRWRGGEGKKGERNTWEGGEESCQKGQTRGELKERKRQARDGDPMWLQLGQRVGGSEDEALGSREARGLGKGVRGEGSLDRDRSHLIFETHLWVPRAWVLPGSGLCGPGNILAKDILGNTCSQL